MWVSKPVTVFLTVFHLHGKKRIEIDRSFYYLAPLLFSKIMDSDISSHTNNRSKIILDLASHEKSGILLNSIAIVNLVRNSSGHSYVTSSH